MNRILTLGALLLVAACSQQESKLPAANESENAAQAAPVEDAVPTLEGQWRVATLDGRPVGADSAMTADFAGGKVSISSGCVRRGWTYIQKRNVVSFAADPDGSSTCEGRGTTVEQETAYAVMTEANIAIFGKDGNEASLSGTGGNLTLERR